jgi:hypothetical protein
MRSIVCKICIKSSSLQLTHSAFTIYIKIASILFCKYLSFVNQFLYMVDIMAQSQLSHVIYNVPIVVFKIKYPFIKIQVVTVIR